MAPAEARADWKARSTARLRKHAADSSCMRLDPSDTVRRGRISLMPPSATICDLISGVASAIATTMTRACSFSSSFVDCNKLSTGLTPPSAAMRLQLPALVRDKLRSTTSACSADFSALFSSFSMAMREGRPPSSTTLSSCAESKLRLRTATDACSCISAVIICTLSSSCLLAASPPELGGAAPPRRRGISAARAPFACSFGLFSADTDRLRMVAAAAACASGHA
mmetsp:Transcript_33594/g.86024  ORF Transcript_33594/g.86024 Transcript_33594/m.86024 type:complete len:225 (+) Transcript_33594:1214-1888(+)